MTPALRWSQGSGCGSQSPTWPAWCCCHPSRSRASARCVTRPSSGSPGCSEKGTQWSQLYIKWKYRTDKHAIKSEPITLTLNTVISSFHKTFQLMMLHHQTKSECWWITVQNISQKQSYSDYMSSVTLTLKTAIYLHDIPAHNDALHYQVQLQKSSNSSEDTVPTNINWNFEHWLWPWPQQSSLLQDTLGSWWCNTKLSLVTKGASVWKL